MIHTNGHYTPNDTITRLFLVRHGETDYNKKGLLQGRSINADLNDTGRQQAEAVARYFTDKQIDFLASSDLNRAVQTAEPVAEQKGLTINRYKEIEEIDFGRMEGMNAEGLGEKLKFIHRSWRRGSLQVAPAGGENPIQAFQRANRLICRLIMEHSGSTMMFVVHGRLIRILISGWLGWGLHRMEHVPHTNGGIYELAWHRGTFGIINFNITSHLKELSTPVGS